MPSSSGYRINDFWRICDRTGRRVLASKTVGEWTGAVVDRRYAIDRTRHPQETQKIVNERQSVDKPRPRPVDVFMGPLTTVVAASAAAGSATIEVESSARFEPGDRIGVLLTGGDLHRATIQSVPDASHLVLLVALPRAVEAGTAIVNYTAVAPSDIA